jgi:hypothetical protein
MDLFVTEIMEYSRKTCALLTGMNTPTECHSNILVESVV